MHSNIGLILGFMFMYSSLVGYLRSVCWKDPTSVFFQAERAHAAPYSTHRIQQAIQYADLAGTNKRPTSNRTTASPELCIGIPSVRRDGISYLKSTLGSLQHGLSAKERESLHFVVFLAHTDQKNHPDYDQSWLIAMADGLPSYSDNSERLTIAELMERDKTHGTKSKFDYSIAMEECVKTGAPYILLVEDDVVFLDGWRHRVMQALDQASFKSWKMGHIDFLYLRLFYYEGLLGWNAESWPTYLGWSIVIVTAVLSLLILSRRYIPAARPYLTYSVLLLVLLVFIPLLLVLLFAAGGNCVLPQPHGVHLMPEHACCGQGLVFPAATVSNELLPLFRNNRWSEVPTDSFIEDYADETGMLRWALTPVVMQHVGGRSSHGVFRGHSKMTPSRLWNFGFEGNDADSLAEEHIRVNNGML